MKRKPNKFISIDLVIDNYEKYANSIYFNTYFVLAYFCIFFYIFFFI